MIKHDPIIFCLLCLVFSCIIFFRCSSFISSRLFSWRWRFRSLVYITFTTSLSWCSFLWLFNSFLNWGRLFACWFLSWFFYSFWLLCCGLLSSDRLLSNSRLVLLGCSLFS